VPAWFVIAGAGVVVTVLALVTTGRWARSTAERIDQPVLV
jgi:hypothetical protein